MSEKTVCLVSGGIDSPVAAAAVAEKREIVPLHFVLHPYYCEETFSLTIRALRKLRKVASYEQMVLFPWGDVLQKIFDELEDLGKRSYSCVLCRKGMFKGASLVCEEVGAGSITTGEVLGQKASQTLENMESTSYGIKYPILRPLAGLDKEEIIKRSKDLGLWMPKHAGCCNATPERPKTRTDPKEVEKLYQKLELENLIRKELKVTETIDLDKRDLYKAFHDYLKKLVG